ncbi:MAG: hypothetical protein ACO3IB_08515, partial [Phycisphaerales bacterium]
MAQGISLANKCQILFGVAVFALLGGALAVPWYRTVAIVTDSQLEVSRQLADTWQVHGFSIGLSEGSPIPMRLLSVDDVVFEAEGATDPFLRETLEAFESNPRAVERFERSPAKDGIRYRYARAIRERDWAAIADERYADWRA